MPRMKLLSNFEPFFTEPVQFLLRDDDIAQSSLSLSDKDYIKSLIYKTISSIKGCPNCTEASAVEANEFWGLPAEAVWKAAEIAASLAVSIRAK